MQMLLDFLPVLGFFGAYVVTKDIFIATAALMIAMPLMLAGHWLITRKVNRVHLISTILVLVLGGITVILKNSVFIAWKPTVLNALLGVACLGSIFIGEKTLMERLLSSSVELTRPQWSRLTVAWALFFFFLGLVNIFVYYNYPEETWAYFKVWGLMGLTLIFAVAQGIWVNAMLNDQPSADS